MRRREFIKVIVGSAAAWPLAARAQQSKRPLIGFLHSGWPEMSAIPLASFRQGLNESGYVEEQNIEIEFRWARDQHDKLSTMAADLVRQQVSVIAAGGGIISAQAARDATATIPIVFASGADPIAMGLVRTLNRPGGNVTGFTFLQTTLEAKRFELLHELVPTAAEIAALINPSNPAAGSQSKDLEKAARDLGVQLIMLHAESGDAFDTIFATLAEKTHVPLVVTSDPYFYSQRNKLVELAARQAIPAIYEWREFAVVGGLISYGTNLKDAYRLVGSYVARILKGEKPADIPVIQPTKYELVINLKTAKALGLTVSNQMQLLADEVIE
jgi:putative ABC transport system substrate-binding protein